MLNKGQLIQKLTAMNLDCYETASDINENISIQLLNFDEFCRFVRSHNIDTVFFHYCYAAPEELQITDDVIAQLKLDSDVLEILQEKFDEYNQSVLQLDFSKPYSLTLYCTHQGFIFYIDADDYWFREAGIEMPQTAAVKFVDEHLSDIMKKKNSSNDLRLQKREELRQQILTDPEFHKCTNQNSRRVYSIKHFLNNEELTSLFFNEQHGLYDISITTFLEEVWREYKQKKGEKNNEKDS